jgi:WD40 repeat protein
MEHRGKVRSAGFSPDGSMVITASEDGNARLWAAADGTPIADALHHDGEVWSASFAPDSASIVTGSADGKVRLWRLQPV